MDKPGRLGPMAFRSFVQKQQQQQHILWLDNDFALIIGRVIMRTTFTTPFNGSTLYPRLSAFDVIVPLI